MELITGFDGRAQQGYYYSVQLRERFARSGLYVSRSREAMRALLVIAPAVLFLYAFRRFNRRDSALNASITPYLAF